MNTNGDFSYSYDGSIVTVSVHTDEARDWVQGNVDAPDHMRWGEGSIHIETKYADDIIGSLLKEGFAVRCDHPEDQRFYVGIVGNMMAHCKHCGRKVEGDCHDHG